MYGDRRGIHVIQHNTKDTKTGEKPENMPLGLASSKDVYHRNNNNDRYQTTMNKMGMERWRMRKEPDKQSSGKATAKIASKTAAAESTFRRGNEDPFDSDLPMWVRVGFSKYGFGASSAGCWQWRALN